MRETGEREILVYCTNPAGPCGGGRVFNVDTLPDDVRLDELEPLLVCSRCGHVGAEVRGHYFVAGWGEKPTAAPWPGKAPKR